MHRSQTQECAVRTQLEKQMLPNCPLGILLKASVSGGESPGEQTPRKKTVRLRIARERLLALEAVNAGAGRTLRGSDAFLLQMGKLRPREGKQFVKSYKTVWGQSCGLNPGPWALLLLLLPFLGTSLLLLTWLLEAGGVGPSEHSCQVGFCRAQIAGMLWGERGLVQGGHSYNPPFFRFPAQRHSSMV